MKPEAKADSTTRRLRAYPDDIAEPFPKNRWVWSLLVALATAMVWVAYGCLPSWQRATGIYDTGKLFWDLDGLLASGEAARKGLNPFLPNPLDFYHRPHVYTEWWLITGRVGLVRAHTLGIGSALMALTLTSALWFLKPVGGRQAGLMVLVLISPAMLMALDRANNDLVVFILMGAAFSFLGKRVGAIRALGVLLLTLTVILKYYPLAALIVLLDARSRREFVGWILLGGLLVLIAWPALEPGLRAAFKYRPNPEWIYAFGAPVIFRNLEVKAPLFLIALGLSLVAAIAFRSLRGTWGNSPASTQSDLAELGFVGGAAMLVGCFVLGSSYAYKFVFCLWLLPWLWRSPVAGAAARWRDATLVLLMTVLWLEGFLAVLLNTVFSGFSHGAALMTLKVGLTVSQLLTWALMICLVRGLMSYVYGRVVRQIAVHKKTLENVVSY